MSRPAGNGQNPVSRGGDGLSLTCAAHALVHGAGSCFSLLKLDTRHPRARTLGSTPTAIKECIPMQRVPMQLGSRGIWASLEALDLPARNDAAQRLERLGYSTLWQPMALQRDLTIVTSQILAQTSELILAQYRRVQSRLRSSRTHLRRSPQRSRFRPPSASRTLSISLARIAFRSSA
jgi:hypothetical protein